MTPVAIDPALALVEFDSIAAGILAGDAMVKKAPVARIVAGTVHPGRYLVLVSGEVAPVQEALAAGLAAGSGSVLDHVYLPGVHPDVPAGIAAARRPAPIEALGIVETASVAAAIQAADAGLKGAQVTLLELRLADGLGGKGLAFFSGSLTDVETAVLIACDAIAEGGQLLNAVTIPQLHAEMAENLLDNSRFRARI
ncbi:MAG TPA: BMC domain-containing protein [Anaerolineae bacterium]|nr:BMC domain-containing protein [Anaerolineae bacterium]HNU03077.1 BMC domain-containing protein [Anaerolineae bacterium]